MFIVNEADTPLPAPALSAKDEARLHQLQARAHLTKPDRYNPTILPLDFKEREEFKRLEGRMKDTLMPTYGGLPLPFTAKGQAGSCYDVDDSVAETLRRQHPEHLIILPHDAEPPVRPIRPGAMIKARLAAERQASRAEVGIAEARSFATIHRETLGGQQEIASVGAMAAGKGAGEV